MPGFPRIPSRSAFGPTFQNVRPVKDPARELDAATMNLLAWQVAGAGRTVPQAWLTYDGSIPSMVDYREAFSPRVDVGIPGNVKNGTGDYTFTYAATYEDENGAEVSFAPSMAIAAVQNGAAGVEATAAVSGQTIRVRVRNAAGTFVDGIVLLLVW